MVSRLELWGPGFKAQHQVTQDPQQGCERWGEKKGNHWSAPPLPLGVPLEGSRSTGVQVGGRVPGGVQLPACTHSASSPPAPPQYLWGFRAGDTVAPPRVDLTLCLTDGERGGRGERVPQSGSDPRPVPLQTNYVMVVPWTRRPSVCPPHQGSRSQRKVCTPIKDPQYSRDWRPAEGRLNRESRHGLPQGSTSRVVKPLQLCPGLGPPPHPQP